MSFGNIDIKDIDLLDYFDLYGGNIAQQWIDRWCIGVMWEDEFEFKELR